MDVTELCSRSNCGIRNRLHHSSMATDQLPCELKDLALGQTITKRGWSHWRDSPETVEGETGKRADQLLRGIRSFLDPVLGHGQSGLGGERL
jgi:hypothetical protein